MGNVQDIGTGDGHTGSCVQGEILFNIPQTPIDIDIRGFNDHLSDYEDVYDDLFLGSARVRLNLNRNGIINPYISGGVYYQEHNWNVLVKDYRTERFIYTTPDSEDDFDFIAGAGVEMKPNPVYLRLDGSVLKDGQFEILAIVGVNLSDDIRLEGGYRYFDLNDYTYYSKRYRYSRYNPDYTISSRRCYFAGLSICF